VRSRQGQARAEHDSAAAVRRDRPVGQHVVEKCQYQRARITRMNAVVIR